MILARPLLMLALTLLLLAAGAANSAELVSGAQLVPGGGNRPEPFAGLWGESRRPLVSSGAMSAGTVSGAAPMMSPQGLSFGAPGAPLAAGGYVALGGPNSQLSSSLRSSGASSGANLSASLGGGLLGDGTQASLSLGISRTDWNRISPNSQYSGLAPADPHADVNMSLSVTRQVSPSLSLGGVAGANRTSGNEGGGNSLMLGAGLGYRF